VPGPLIVNVAVRDLARFITREGSLGGATWRSATRGWEGVRAHQRALAERPEGYQREKAVRAEFRGPECTLRVEGRVDGCRADEEEWWVEEVKSTRLDLALPHPDRALHRAQALLYAALLLRENPRPWVRLRLLYVHLDTGSEWPVEETMPATEALSFLAAAVEDYSGWMARVHEDRHDSRRAALTARPPFAGWRPGQEALSDLVRACPARGGGALAEAPTGLGKTAAVLHGAARALADGAVEKVFYLTARNSGKASAREALARLHAAGFRLRAVEITAREKVCRREGEPCVPGLCPATAAYYARLRPALEEWLDLPPESTPAALHEVAARHQLCPYAFALDAAEWSAVVLCDYNHAFDPQARLRRFFDEERRPWLLLVDEAHNLPARARAMHSPTWDGRQAQEAATGLSVAWPLLAREIRALGRRLRDRLDAAGEESVPLLRLPAPPEDLTPALRRLFLLAEAALAGGPDPDFRPPLLRLLRDTSAWLAALDTLDERSVFLLEPQGPSARARLFCRDPSRAIARVVESVAGAVFFSATLRPLDAFREQLGLDRHATPSLALASPFDPEHFRVTVDDSLSTTFRERAANLAAIAARIRAFLSAEPGPHLVFFPSFAFLDGVALHFELEVNFGRIQLQRPGMSETERASLLERFTRESASGFTAFAVLGGVFGEGVDLPGDRLRGVVVVGAGLPPVSPEQELIRAWYEEQGRPGFDFAYTFPGFNRVLQAVGRVIRTETDTGAALLIDRRYATPRYRGLFPDHWRLPKPPGADDAEGPIQWME
jgi:DNA excision repair protein ERCC-2